MENSNEDRKEWLPVVIEVQAYFIDKEELM